MKRSRTLAAGAVTALVASVGLAACGAPGGASSGGGEGNCPARASEPIGDTIKLGASMPLSGPLAAIGQDQIGLKAYADFINEQGGIDGRELEVVVLDDKGQPQNAVANIQRLISQEDVDLLSTVAGTAVNLATSPISDEECVPSIALAGSGELAEGKYPSVIPGTTPFAAEGIAVAADIKETVGDDAVIGILEAQTETGNDAATRLTEAAEELGLKVLPSQKVGAEETTPPNAQVRALQDAGANVVAILTAPFQCPGAVSTVARSGWKPDAVYVIDICSFPATMSAAGDAANGVKSANYLIDPTNPEFADREDVQDYLAAIEATGSGSVDVAGFVATGWVNAALTVGVLQQVVESGEELTQENIIAAMDELDGMDLPLLHEGITVSTSPENLSPWDSFAITEYQDGHFGSNGVVPVK